MRVMRRLRKYIRPYVRYGLLAALSLTALTSLGLARPKLTQLLIDRVIYSGEMNLLPWVALGVVIIALLRGVFRYLKGVFTEHVGINVCRELRDDIFAHLMRLPYSYYDEVRTGELMSRVIGDVDAIRQFISNAVLELYDCILTFAIVLVIIWRMNWQLSMVALATMPFLLWLVLRFDGKIRPTYTEIREQMAVLTSTIQENITGVRVVKAFSRQQYEVEKFDKENTLNKKKQLQAESIRAFYFPLMDIMGSVSAIGVVWFGGYLVIYGRLTVGELVAFYSYIWALVWPIRSLGFLVNVFAQGLISAQRVFEIMDTIPEIRNRHNPLILSQIKGHVKFNNVSFSYGDVDVLTDINIDAKPGKTIALVGETGSGKTSLVNMICRFYDVSEGSVTIDGHDVRTLSLSALRQSIGIVQQDSFLFSDTIRANITLGRPGVGDDDIIKISKAVQAHDFIMEMGEGYNTSLGERGIGLSGGQRQRIAIARALIKNPAILILDDATSSVDIKTEFQIQQALSKLRQNQTTFVIAHRISTIKHADEILVIKNGRIVERGQHETLMQDEGVYKSLYEVQYKEQELALAAADGSDS